MPNQTDIYRRTRIANPTNEHILQAGLGANLQRDDLIDSKTNADLGSTIDPVLLKDYEFVRTSIGLETRRRKPLRVESAAGESFDIQGIAPVPKASGGKPWAWTAGGDGQRRLTIETTSVEKVDGILKDALAEKGLSIEDIAKQRMERIREYVGPVRINLKFGGPLHHRAIAKSCVNLLATVIGPESILVDGFNVVRDYVVSGIDNCDALDRGDTDSFPRICAFDSRPEIEHVLNSFSGKNGDSVLSHKLLVQGSSRTGVVYAAVSIFGHVPYTALLTDSWSKSDFAAATLINPLKGQRSTRQIDLPPGTLPLWTGTNVLAHSHDIESMKTSIASLCREALKVADDAAGAAIVEETIQEVLGEADGQLFTPEKANALVRKMAIEIVRHSHRLDSRDPIDPPS